MRVAIATLATGSYIPGAERLFTSILLHNNLNEVDFLCLTDEPQDMQILGGKVVKYVKLEGLPNSIGPKASERFLTTLFKLQVFKLVEDSEYDRVVLLDADMLCLGSIASLISKNEFSAPLSAVRDYAVDVHYPRAREVVGARTGPIFNTGCLIVNREVTSFFTYRQLLSAIRLQGTSYDGGDQGYVNWAIHRHGILCQELPIKFNFTLDPHYPAIFQHPVFVHFTGRKPWLSREPFQSKDYWIHRLSERMGRKSKASKKSTWPNRAAWNVVISIIWFARNSLHLVNKVSMYPKLRGLLKNRYRGPS
jgi:lipopolysaccharide biosynthesis glycosyltransferase